MAGNIQEKIELYYSSLSKGQKKIADYISENYEKASFMTAADLGNATGVSESTVVRFAVRIGFDGYPEFQKNLRDTVKSRLTSVQRMDAASNISDDDILRSALLQDAETIRRTMETVSLDAFAGSVQAINEAKKIYILGVRSSSSLAAFAAFYMGYIYDVVLVNTSASSEMFEQMYHITKDDLCIAISFPRYSNRTINALKFALSRGAKIISITDAELSPIAKYATHLLLAPSNMVSFVDSLVAPLSLINALIAAASREKKDEVHSRFEDLEHLWQEYRVYSTSGEEQQ
ncbi:MAG: MurR/RpiR family transcriptional regulator [Clostridia bacterium]|nr:MurR/RpiR family transcriptional regulator [Clostridia bacterium]